MRISIVKIFSQNKKLFTIIFLFFVFFLSLSLRSYTLYEPYLLRHDGFFYYHQSDVLLNQGNIETDILRMYPDGVPYKPDFFVYLITYSYKLFNLLLPQPSLLAFCFWFSLFIGALSVFPIFFIGRILFSNLVGVLSALFFTLSPVFLLRSMSGDLDTDGINLLFLSLIICFFIAALSKVDLERVFKRKALTFSFLAGFLLFLWSWAWVGSWLAFWIVLSLLFFHFCIHYFSKKSFLSFKNYFFVYLIFFLSFFLFTLVFLGIDVVKETLISPFSFFQIKTSAEQITPEGFPSLRPFIDELQAPKGFINAISNLGSSCFFIGILGFILIILCFVKNINKSKWQYLFPLLTVFFITTLFPFSKSIRYGEFFALPLALCAGFCVLVIWKKSLALLLEKRLDKSMFILSVVLIFFCFYFTFNIAYLEAFDHRTGINSQWGSALNFLKQKTNEDAVVLSWSDYGYWILTTTNRKVILDNGSFGGLKETDLDSASREECFDRKGIIKDNICITSRIQDFSNILFTDDPQKALNIIKNYKGEASEVYLLLSADLIPRSYIWTYCATWDRETEAGNQYKYAAEYDEKSEETKFFIPDELKNSLFTRLLIYNEEVPGFELKFNTFSDNYFSSVIKIYKVSI